MGDPLTAEQLEHIERVSLTPERSVAIPTMQLRQLVREHQLRGEEVAKWAHESGTAKGARDRLGRQVEHLRGENEDMEREIATLKAALIEALDGWQGCWESDNNDPPPPRIAELRKIGEVT